MKNVLFVVVAMFGLVVLGCSESVDSTSQSSSSSQTTVEETSPSIEGIELDSAWTADRNDPKERFLEYQRVYFQGRTKTPPALDLDLLKELASDDFINNRNTYLDDLENYYGVGYETQFPTNPQEISFGPWGDFSAVTDKYGNKVTAFDPETKEPTEGALTIFKVCLVDDSIVSSLDGKKIKNVVDYYDWDIEMVYTDAFGWIVISNSGVTEENIDIPCDYSDEYDQPEIDFS